MKNKDTVLHSHDVHPERGFIPAQDPLDQLPEAYAVWDEISTSLTDFINAGIARGKLEAMPVLSGINFYSEAEWERAMMLLSFFAHAYVHSGPNPVDYIPESIAVPWIESATHLGRLPILSHRSIVLTNWKRIDSDRPIQLDNLATQCQFHGGLDESWFYLVTVDVERAGANAIPLVVESMYHLDRNEIEQATACLSKANTHLEALTPTLQKMYEQCDPYIFYTRIRPFLASFENIDYRGTGLERQSHHGGSAAQSSLLQFFDAAFGIEYEDERTLQYLRLMRNHMPKRHADFLRHVERNSQVKQSASRSEEFNKVYEESVSHLIDFRNEHLKVVALYIMKQAKDANKRAVGTGGTSPMLFLKSVRDQNQKAIDD